MSEKLYEHNIIIGCSNDGYMGDAKRVKIASNIARRITMIF